MVPEDDDKTRIGGVPPPSKIPSGPPVKKPAETQDDHTQFASPPPPAKMPGGAPPAAVPLAAVPPAQTAADRADHTQFAAAPPPGVLRPPATPPSPPPSRPAPPTDADATVMRAAAPEDATVIIAGRAQSMVRLQRVQPAGRSEMIALDRSTYLLGRSHTSDIELFTPTASREHARLVCRDGQWYLQPFEQHTVLVDGKMVRHEARVTNRMRLQLGDDELVFLDGSAPAAAAPANGSRTMLLVAVGAALVVLAAVAWFLFVRGK